jgi:hypothetical protein
MTCYVGVDLHRRRSVIVVLDPDGSELWTKRIDNDRLTLGLEIDGVMFESIRPHAIYCHLLLHSVPDASDQATGQRASQI